MTKKPGWPIWRTDSGRAVLVRRDDWLGVTFLTFLLPLIVAVVGYFMAGFGVLQSSFLLDYGVYAFFIWAVGAAFSWITLPVLVLIARLMLSWGIFGFASAMLAGLALGMLIVVALYFTFDRYIFSRTELVLVNCFYQTLLFWVVLRFFKPQIFVPPSPKRKMRLK